jgi:hypothetical protein
MHMFTHPTEARLNAVLGYGLILLLAVNAKAGVAAASEPATVPMTNAATVSAAPTPADQVEAKWGIQVSGLFLSAGGNMVDFRYKVVDPAKAAFLTRPDTKPELIKLDSGVKLIVPDTPKVGQLRQIVKNPVAGKMYFILFANTRQHVKSGDKVTIAAGDFKVENLTVE